MTASHLTFVIFAAHKVTMGIQERKERERARRRNDIINSAEELFFEPQGDGTTMDAIAEKAELSKGTLYLYFKNKQDLKYAIAEKGVNTLKDILVQSVKKDLSGLEQLSDLGDAFVLFVEKHQKYLELILKFEIKDDSDINTQPRMLIKPALEVLLEVIEQGQKDATIRNDFSAQEVSIILWSQMMGLMQTILRFEKYNNIYPIDINNLIRGHFKLVIKGIKKD